MSGSVLVGVFVSVGSGGGTISSLVEGTSAVEEKSVVGETSVVEYVEEASAVKETSVVEGTSAVEEPSVSVGGSTTGLLFEEMSVG